MPGVIIGPSRVKFIYFTLRFRSWIILLYPHKGPKEARPINIYGKVRPRLTILPFQFACFLFGALALNLYGAGTEKAVVHARAAFVFPSPDETTEMIKLLKRGTEVKLLDKKVDELNRLWYKLRDKSGDSGWVQSHDLKILAGEDSSKTGKALHKNERVTISKRSKGERLQFIKDNPAIDRRIKKLIKDGFVGMGMSYAEVKASLGPPDAQRTELLLKRGRMPVWIYNLKNPVGIIFEEGKVSGWSQE